MIQSLLIANRGEIARRIIRTARRMGIRTIAVHSDVDAGMPFVREADDAVCIGTAPARDSYLRQDRILAAARETGAEAIHPGYGFLSENAGFADAVIDAGLVWVGAPPAAIRAMGLKDAAKARMIAAGVPVTPGYLGADQSPARLRAEADAIGYPVLVKAVAGGGGKGMRRVESAADFADALASCKREAAAAFGDDRVLIENYILSPRHIEVQVFGDTHGNVVHLFERDCSLQRRHQKVIEEAPAPGMDPDTRAAICAAAVKAAQAVDYVGAGTIEFIADASEGLRADRIWFMEMNTRLQVEHPVTEAITGQDLVEWQLRVASGEPLPGRQDELAIDGWAIEARLYAENPATGFLPSTGRLDRFLIPEDTLRVDAGVSLGDEITAFYDPMIAKLIAWAPTRGAAAADLVRGASAVQIYPVRTNAAFLARALANEEFLAGRIDTGFIERNGDTLIPASDPDADVLRSAAVQIAQSEYRGRPEWLWPEWKIGDESRLSLPQGQVWREALGFRLNAPASSIEVALMSGGRAYRVDLGQDVTHHRYRVDEWQGGAMVEADGQSFYFEPATATLFTNAGGGATGDGAILAPMPGRVIAVAVAEGETVTRGQRLVVVEAMKMEQALLAPFDGVVAELMASEGAQVSEGTLLARIEATA